MSAENAIHRLELMVEAANLDRKSFPRLPDYFEGNFNAYQHALEIVRQELS